MKFGKSLSNQIEEALPEWRDKFLSYKDLKKRLKLMAPKGGNPAKRPRLSGDGEEPCSAETATAATPEEQEFVRLLDAELDKFNAFFVEKEEEYIIRQKLLQERVEKGKDSKEKMIKVKKEIVDFHGEMVLLENYSALNYTGLVKILKKYDKRTGALMRLPFIQRVLHQPFFTTDLLFKLVKECERMLDHLFSANEPTLSCATDGGEAEPEDKKVEGSKSLLKESPELEEIEYMESLYMKSTMAALRALKEIRSGSSTVSVFSLPPLQNAGVDECWSKIPYLEQIKVAK
ncbi:SPX domain-containing protein 1-like [Nymphaea colorata]|nr:SPX domain-containing protein 1-like [Nymphaea colorata]